MSKNIAVAADKNMVLAQAGWQKALFISLLAILVLMTVMSFWYGISGDEMDMNAYGKAILHYFTTFGKDTTALHPPKDFDRDGVLRYYGGFFDLIAALATRISPLGEYATRHILNAWAGFLAIFFAAKICMRISGARMAVICCWLMFLAPFFLGHAMNNPKDIPFATAYIACIYLFIRFYEKLPGARWKDYILPIISLIIAIDIRAAGILLIPYMFIWLFWNYILYREKRQTIMKALVPFAIISIAGYLLSSLFWPYALQNPLANPLKALSALSDFKVSLNQLYEGERIFSNELPASYLVHNFFITNSYILIAGMLLAPFFILGNLKTKAFPLISFIVFITVFPVAYIMYKHANVYHAWRHVLFIFPGAAVTSAYGIDRLGAWVGKGIMRYVMAGLIVIGFLEPLVFIIRTFPNTITYYNFFAGGVQEAYYNYEMDYYFNSMKETTDWFIRNELPELKDKDSVIIATNNAGIIGQYFKSYPKLKVRYVRFYERSMSDWDFAIFHRALIPADQLQNGSWVINKTIHTTSVYDLPLTIVVKRPSKDDYLGFEALRQNKLEEGISYLLRYRTTDPRNELVDGLLSRYYLSVNKTDSARALANETLSISPDNMDARMVLSALNSGGQP